MNQNMSTYPSKLPKPPLLPRLPTEQEIAICEQRMRQTEESERLRMLAYQYQNKATARPCKHR